MSLTTTMSPTTAATPDAVSEFRSLPSTEILASLYRMNVDQYERLVQTGVLSNPHIELIDGLLVKTMGKNPPHSWTVDAIRGELTRLLPPGWSLRQEQPVRIPNFDEPEPDLAVARGTRDDYANRHPGPTEIGMLVEVSESTLDRDRGDKQLAYAQGGVPIYWIVNLVDRQVEVYTGPTPTGYQDRRVFGPNEKVPVIVDGKEVGQIGVSDILPRGVAAGAADPRNGP
jgi:Uma2 family endonuclease